MKLDDVERGNPLRLIVMAIVSVVVLVIGVLMIVNLVGGSDDDGEPDSPSAQAGGDPELPKFAADPVFDSYGRVVYIPKDAAHGVALSKTLTADTSRSQTQKPDGVLLQQVNDEMVLPFSAADGPTGFTRAGVATGFSHTAQGAALAAIHYSCWMTKPVAHTERLEALRGQGIVDSEESLNKRIELYRTVKDTSLDLDGECTPSQLKVDYDPVLTKVWLGYGVSSSDPNKQSLAIAVIVQWHDGDWILQLSAYDKGEAGGHYGDANMFDPAKGWVSWFAS